MMDKLEHTQKGDYIEHQGLTKVEKLGPIEIIEGESGKIILVPGRMVRQVAVQEHRILAVFRDEKEIIRF